MPVSLEVLARTLKPSKTALLLGAGASVPSGAPSGAMLAQRLWKDIAKTEPISDDLIETASILERRYRRVDVVNAIAGVMKKLKPTGGLLGLPRFGWHSLYTTNFDQLVEAAYKECSQALCVIRSNYDFSEKDNRSDTTLYKIHGCVSQDKSLGHKSSMTLTESDYEDFSKYRQALFLMLSVHLMTGDLLIIGQSLSDKHLSDLIKNALKLKDEGGQGEVYALVYNKDDLRAQLLEDRGAKIAFGGIDEFIHQMAESAPAVENSTDPIETDLPLSLVSIVDDAAISRLKDPNTLRMFNGGPATFADIRAGSTFERSLMPGVIEKLQKDKLPVVTLVGAAGVGKTTLGRQIVSRFIEEGYMGFEHKSDFAFRHQPWVEYEASLRATNRKAVLLLDECTRYLRQTNLLVDHLETIENPALLVVMTANAAQWGLRVKSAHMMRDGRAFEISRLLDADIKHLVNLLGSNKGIADLVHKDFKTLSRGEQIARLKGRCSADMFVCLKNIFANDSLDAILLREYEELDEGQQENYRYIAALESVGMRVHRFLVTRLRGFKPEQVATVLSGLNGIVDEYEIDAREGIYAWATRHLVIARKITEYKFAPGQELEGLFSAIIENLNPAVRVELQSVRDLCDKDYGIGRLSDSAKRRKLYRDLIRVAPGERSPWHRLIRELLADEQYEEVEYVIRDAIEAVGQDAPIDRYRVRLLVLRAENTIGISEKDRVAIMRKAYETATANVRMHSRDKYSYRTLCQVADKLAGLGEGLSMLEDSIGALRGAAAELSDPEIDDDIRQYEQNLARLKAKRPALEK